jgi:pimeloyl-ACP methyl ester carboxylesterase
VTFGEIRRPGERVVLYKKPVIKKLTLTALLILLIALAVGSISWRRSPRQEEVRFYNGEIVLAGTIYLPSSEGRHPAVIFIHGSGDDSREQYRFYANLLAKKGIAALIYDKRGVGASSGSWKLSPFGALADDALAGVHFLKSHPAIDAKRIGAWGGSEGAIIAPWIASRSSDVAFVIMQSATGVTFAQQNRYQNERQLRAATNSEENIAQGLAIIKLQSDYARTGTGWQAYANAKQAVSEKAWASSLGATLPPDHWWWNWYRTKMDYDPIPMLEKVRVPVLAVWGENDVLVPVSESRVAIESAFARGGNRSVNCHVFAGADHSIQTESRLHGYGPDSGYLTILTEWVLKQTTVPR